MGFSLGLSGSKEKSKTTDTPWQAGDLRFAFDEARNQYDQGPYQGNYVAGIDPYQQAAYDQAPGAIDQYQQGGQDIYGAGREMLPHMAGAGDYYSGAAGGDWLNNYQNPMAGGMNPDVVGSYINNDILEGQIDAASRDVTRNLYEGQLPQNRMAHGSVGMGGASTQDIRAGVLERGAGDRIGDIAADMRGNAYQTGIQADMTRQGMQQNANMAGLQDQQFGAAGMYNIGQTGANMMQTGGQMGVDTTGMYAGMGDYMQDLNQGQIEGDMGEYYAPWDIMDRYYGIVGAGDWGGTIKTKGSAIGASMGGSDRPWGT